MIADALLRPFRPGGWVQHSQDQGDAHAHEDKMDDMTGKKAHLHRLADRKPSAYRVEPKMEPRTRSTEKTPLTFLRMPMSSTI